MDHRLLKWSVLILAIVVITGHNIAISPWLLDDAYISFRYAENFASGEGLVFNIGERVEGYTSFLWVVCLALGKTLGVDIALFAKILGILFSLCCLLLLLNARRFLKDIPRQVPVIATLFLGTCGIFTPWATSGMEVTLFAFVTLLFVLLYVSAKEQNRNGNEKYNRNNTSDRLRFTGLGFTGVIGAILAFTRPEGLLIFAVAAGDLLITGLRKKERAFWHMVVPFLIAYVPYFLWRYWYYGYFLPNTFYAKVGFSGHQIIRGAFYTWRFAISALFLLLPFILALCSSRWLRRFAGRNIMLLIVLVYILYIVAVGGDCMPAFRFFAPIVPIICFFSAMSLPLLTKRKGIVIGIAVAVVLYNVTQMRIAPEIYDQIRQDDVALYGREVGLWLRANADPKAVIATNTSGSIPYYSKLRTVDMLGLNDEHIAHRDIASLGQGLAGHEKGDGDYVLSRNPDYIQFSSSWGSKYPVFLSDLEIYKNPAFHRLYSLKMHRLISGKNFLIYERKDNGSLQ